MDLEELQKRLYKEKSKFEDRPEAPAAYEPGRTSQKVGSESWQEEPSRPPSRWNFLFSKKTRLWAMFSLVFFILLAAALFWWGLFSFDRGKLEFEIYAPDKIVSGETVNYVVQYKNKNKVDLEEVKLTFYFPEGAVLDDEKDQENLYQEENLGVLKAGEGGQKEFKVQLTGLKGETKEAKARISFKSSNISSGYEKETSVKTEIVAVPLTLNLSLPDQVVSGQETTLSLQYLNDSNISFRDLKLMMKYPNGFIFNEAIPEPVEEKIIWRFNEMAPQENGEIKISGVLSGDGGEVKSFEAILGLEKNGDFVELVRALRSSQIAQAPLSVSQKVNSSSVYTANWGDKLRYEIFYKNTSGQDIRGVTVSTKIESAALDLKTLSIPEGSFNSNTGTVVWTAEGIKDLEYLVAGQEGTLVFDVNVLAKPKINSYQDKNFVIKTTAKIDSPNIPLSLRGTQIGSENILETKVNSLLQLGVAGYFNDDRFSNSGPTPPRVGQKTYYSVYWSITNASNKTVNSVVSAFLPNNVEWTGNVYPAGEKISFDSSTRKVIWEIGEIDSGVGYVLPAKQVIFQVALTPSIVQVQKPAALLQKSTISARDLFTLQDLSSETGILTTELENDPGLDRNDFYVVE